VLSNLYGDTVCQGVRLIVSGVDVLVDLPCSGARTLLLGLLGFAMAASLSRPRLHQALGGLVVTLVSAAVANVLRITVLAIGLAEPQRLGGIPVMERPWHDIIGLCALALVCLTVVGWARCVWPPAAESGGRKDSQTRRNSGVRSDSGPVRQRLGIAAGVGALAAAVAIVNLPRTPLDVAQAVAPARLPLAIEGYHRLAVALSSREAQFFTQFGGWAAKAEYGPHGVLVTRTTSPLRHLHAPDDCLRGLGFDVQYLGAVFEPIPTAIYRAIAPDGRRYRIDVSFVSDRGAVTTNVATAVWLWLQGEARAWMAVQRISPEAMPPEQQARFAQSVLAALDLAQTTDVATLERSEIQ
jgi:exosortase/archaeosortase family protein